MDPLTIFPTIPPTQQLSASDWTVTATKGTLTSSKTIAINTAEQYDMRIYYRLYLRKGYDACTDATGGWTNKGRAYSSSYTNQHNLTVSNITTPEGIKLNQGTAGSGGTYVTNNAINVTPYSALKYTGKIVSAGNNEATVIQIGTSAATGYFSNYTARFVQGASQTKTYEDSTVIDLSSRTGNFYVSFSIYSTDGKNFQIYELYLEP